VEAEFRAVANVVPGVHASFLRPNGERKAQAAQAAHHAREQERARLALLFQDSAHHLFRKLHITRRAEAAALIAQQRLSPGP
jgi:hypothetical protein